MIGLVDWGIGGLGIARELETPFLYLSDTGSTPYGKLDRRALASRLRKAISFLRDRGADRVLLACNAASTALPDLADLDHVSGVIRPTIAHVAKMQVRSVAIVGGRRTILSRAYATGFRARNIRVVQRIAQPLSGMIERGEQNLPSFANAVREVLRGTRGADVLVLACTHYPAAMSIFEKHFRGRVIDPAPAILRSITTRKSAHGKTQIFTTGDPHAMRRAAKLAWGDAFAKLRAGRVRICATKRKRPPRRGSRSSSRSGR